MANYFSYVWAFLNYFLLDKCIENMLDNGSVKFKKKLLDLSITTLEIWKLMEM